MTEVLHQPIVQTREPDAKAKEDYRNYANSNNHAMVSNTYRINHTCQTLEYVLRMKQEHLKFDKGKLSVWEVIDKLDALVDESDPDADFPQIFHACQTAEALRKSWPELDWLHLVGLLHDLGKILALPEYGNLPQWSVVGDTFPVGCRFSNKICLPEYFVDNPDSHDPRYNTQYGIYSEGCGIDNLHISWGHDEYLYQVLVHNKCKIPVEGLKAIRYHSFYAWHTGGDYRYFMNEEDHKTLQWVLNFNTGDLYSKTRDLPDPTQLKSYYESLVEKYFPNPVLEW